MSNNQSQSLLWSAVKSPSFKVEKGVFPIYYLQASYKTYSLKNFHIFILSRSSEWYVCVMAPKQQQATFLKHVLELCKLQGIVVTVVSLAD